MKKISLWTYISVILLAGFFLGRDFKKKNPNPPQLEAAITANSSTLFKKVLITPKENSPKMDSEVLVLQDSGVSLFENLEERKILRHFTFEKVLSLLQQRFQNPSNDHEAAARMGLLKSLAQQHPYSSLSHEQKEKFVSFHKTLALDKTQNFMVRTVAARNLRPWMTSLSHEKKLITQQEFEPHLLSTAAKTETQIFEEVLGSHD